MDTRDEPDHGGGTPRERVSRLSAAILRIVASLDVDTVLREVVDSARALTGARNGVIDTVDEAGRPQDFVMSGLTPGEERRMAGWLPDGLRRRGLGRGSVRQPPVTAAPAVGSGRRRLPRQSPSVGNPVATGR